MQRSIDAFFKKIPVDKRAVELDSPPAAKKKRKARIIESSDEDEISESPQVAKVKEHKKPRNIEEEPCCSKTVKSKKPSLHKLKNSPTKHHKRVDANAYFGGEMVRVEAKKPPKPKEREVIELEDDEIDQSLMEIDVNESLLVANVNDKRNERKNTPPKKEEVSKESAKTPRKDRADKTPEKHKKEKSADKLKREKSTEKRKHSPKDEKLTPNKQSSEETKAKKNKHTLSEEQDEQVSSSSAKKSKVDKEQIKLDRTPKAEKVKEKSAPKPKPDHSDLDSSVLSDEERHDRRRLTAILYQKYKNRTSVINPGSKEVPKGKPNCLAGLSFLVTGVLESLERDECNSIIKEYGGKVMGTVGKRLNYLIVGEDAGPKKLAQAEEFGTRILSEDDLFDLIREKSGDLKKTNGASNKAETSTKSPKDKRRKEEVKVKNEKKPEFSPEKKYKKLKEEEPNNNHSKVKPQKVEIIDLEAEIKTETKTATEADTNIMAWVDKYKPTSIKDIVGQQGPASNVTKLMNWLSKWYVNHDGKKKPQRPNPWAKNDDGSFYKAALLSGPPGIGKTTTATLVCKELGFDTVEFNASDTRSKRLLKEEVSELLSNKSLYGYCHGNAQAVSKKHVLIMDEVDGMAGNEDRGGIQELIALIKDSSVPIICMCNDRNHQKMRSLVNYCYDLRFNRPRLEQIKGRIMSICFREHIKLEPTKVEEIIAATNNDIRQSINHIALLSAGKELCLKSDSAQSKEKIAQKDLKIGPWEVVRKVFSADEHKHMSFIDKCDLFFHDYSLAPLFVQQNYLQVSPKGPKSEVMRKVALTADSLSLGDLVDKRIRSSASWSLLPTQAVFSSVLPGEYMSGYFTGQINFPGWLGKNSRANKRNRLAQEIHDHTRLRTSGSRLSIRLDYAPFLLDSIVRPLKEKGMDGVAEALNVLKEYRLLREDIDSLIELTTWPGKKSIMDAVDGRVKAALTRAYNKEVLAYSYSVTAGVKKKKVEESESLALEEGEEGEAIVLDSDEDKDADDLAHDGLIKAKKKTVASSAKASTSKAAGKKSTAGTSKASSSKAKK